MNKNTIALPPTESFSKMIDGKQTGLYILRNKKNVHAAITNYGARWVSMLIPGTDGSLRDVVVGFDSVDGYIHSTEGYYGAVVGRYANRIAKGKFTLDGKEYTLAINNPPNHLHGGIKAFHAVVWDVVSADDHQIHLRYFSRDGEEGYPGNVEANVIYTLTDHDEMEVDFTATTDSRTVLSLAHHAYFNLNGQGSSTILEHVLSINADHYTPIDDKSIPYGTLEPVGNSPFDFRSAERIGARINDDDEQLKHGSGYDHNFALNDAGAGIRLAASVLGDKSGIRMEVFTDEPGVQLYTGNFMNNKNKLKGGFTDGNREAFCLETQHFPDSPNHPQFPSTVLDPGNEYQSSTIFRFIS
jgi:aldose 1-epimerase